MTTSQIVAALAAATTREQGHEILAPLTAAQLREVAKELEVHAPAGRKEKVAERIVDATVGMRLDHAAIRDGGWR